MPVLTIGYPMTLNGKIEYALFIHTPMPYILQTIDEVRNLILNVVGFIGSIVFIWIYTIAKQMTRPLKEMNSVAKNIASGQFNERIEVIGNDEIAELGLSLNHMAEELDKIEEIDEVLSKIFLMIYVLLYLDSRLCYSHARWHN